MRWIENHALAEREVRTGWLFEDHVAELLRTGGLDVVQPPKTWRADVSQRHDYVNELDLLVNGLRMSVKSRRVRFTCPEDIPSNRNPLFVDTVRKWALKEPEPAAVICVSQETRAAIWTPTAHKARWGTKRAFDQVRRYPDDFMTCDKSLWYPLDELIQHAHSVWDGAWRIRGGILGVKNNCVVHTGTDANLRYLVGRKFHDLLPHASQKPERVNP